MNLETITSEQMRAILAHPPEWYAERRKGIGGSDARAIMDGDWADLWNDKMGKSEPEDLSGVLPVIMGSWTEPLNRLYFEQETGMEVSLENIAHQVHPDFDFMRANLDGRVSLGIFEAKHVNAFRKPDDVRKAYYAQLQHNMAVVGASVCYLSIIFGSNKWEMFEVPADPDFQDALIYREQEFWSYVVSGKAPPLVPHGSDIPVPPIDEMREVDMAGNNEWGSAAVVFIQHQSASKAFESAKKTLKGMVEPDVKKAHGYGVTISRSASGSLTVKAESPAPEKEAETKTEGAESQADDAPKEGKLGW